MSAVRVVRALLVAVAAGSLLATGAAADVTGPPGVDIDGYELVGSVRIDRNWFEYTYRADLVNPAFDGTFGATLSTTAPSILPVDATLTFGEIFEGGATQSVDTFTIRVNRSVPFDEQQLDWLVAAAPLPPTTFELIDAARANGQIDHETELIYKMYDTFGDPRLPAAFQGRDDGFLEDPITAIVESEWSSLSPATQGILGPFLLSIFEPGNWEELELPLGISSATSGISAAAAPAPSGPQSVDTVNGKVRIWWLPQRPQDEARAIALANELDSYLWQKLTSAFRSPIPDLEGLTPTGPDYFGPDDRLDVLLTRTKRAYVKPTLVVCDGRPMGAYIRLGPGDGKEVLAHELMHVIQYAYPSYVCQKPPSELDWMAEATANWALHFAYPTANLEHGGKFGGRRFVGAAEFMMSPEVELNFSNKIREYGAYLWFMHLAGQDNNAGPVRAAWEGIATQTSLASIEALLQSSGRGGFARQWPAFALRDWNRVARVEKPYREFFQWDRLRHRAAEAQKGPQRIEPPNNGATIVPIDHDLPPLSTRYQHFDFRGDTKTHQLWVENEYADPNSRAGLWAIVKIKNRGWVQARDWTDRRKVLLCRDKVEENVEELILVVSNRFHVPGNVGDPGTVTSSPITMTLSPLPCNDWLGTANFDTAEVFEGGTLTTSSRATGVRFVLDEARSSPAINYYRTDAGTATWTIEETGGSCATRHAEGSFDVAGDLMIMLGGATLYHGIFGLGPGSSTDVTVACPGGPTDFSFSFDAWMPSSIGFLPLANGATRIQGSQLFDPLMPAVGGWTWDFNKVP